MWPALITDAMHTCWALFPQKPLVSEWRPTGVLYNWALIWQLVEGRSGLRSRSPALLSEEHSPTLVLHNVFVEHCSTSTRQEPHQGTLGPRNGVETSSLRLGLLQQLNFTQSSVKYNDTLSSSLPLFFLFLCRILSLFAAMINEAWFHLTRLCPRVFLPHVRGRSCYRGSWTC